MLTLRLKSGEYLTIGDDIAIQVFRQAGDSVEVAVKAPREIPVLRGGVLERSGKRPAGLRDSTKKSGVPGKGGRQFSSSENQAVMEQITALVDRLESEDSCPKEDFARLRGLLDRLGEELNG